jgi:hypothetical protein
MLYHAGLKWKGEEMLNERAFAIVEKYGWEDFHQRKLGTVASHVLDDS